MGPYQRTPKAVAKSLKPTRNPLFEQVRQDDKTLGIQSPSENGNGT